MKSKSLSSVLGLAVAVILSGCPSPNSSTKVEGGDPKSTQQSKNNGGISVDHEGAHGQMGGDTIITEAELGAPFYPGSTDKAGTAFKVETPTEKNYISVRETPDSMEKIKAFYEAKIKDIKITMFKSSGNDMLLGTGDLASGAKISITAVKKPGEKVTELSVGTVTSKR